MVRGDLRGFWGRRRNINIRGDGCHLVMGRAGFHCLSSIDMARRDEQSYILEAFETLTSDAKSKSVTFYRAHDTGLMMRNTEVTLDVPNFRGRIISDRSEVS